MAKNQSFPKMDEFPFANEILGLSLAEAQQKVKQYNFSVRAINIDGKQMMCTKDMNRKRINVHLRNEKVSRVINIG